MFGLFRSPLVWAFRPRVRSSSRSWDFFKMAYGVNVGAWVFLVPPLTELDWEVLSSPEF